MVFHCIMILVALLFHKYTGSSLYVHIVVVLKGKSFLKDDRKQINHIHCPVLNILLFIDSELMIFHYLGHIIEIMG